MKYIPFTFWPVTLSNSHFLPAAWHRGTVKTPITRSSRTGFAADPRRRKRSRPHRGRNAVESKFMTTDALSTQTCVVSVHGRVAFAFDLLIMRLTGATAGTGAAATASSLDTHGLSSHTFFMRWIAISAPPGICGRMDAFAAACTSSDSGVSTRAPSTTESASRPCNQTNVTDHLSCHQFAPW